MRKTLPVGLLGAGLFLTLAGACGGGAGITSPTPGTRSTVSLTIVRSASLIPANADSAFVKVWGGATDVVVPTAIPAPGASNVVSIDVPPGSNYSIEIVAFHDIHDGIRVALAGGEVSNLTFNPGTNSETVPVAPWAFTVAGPDTIQSGVPAAYTWTVTEGPTDLFTTVVEVHSQLGLNMPDDHFNVTGNGTTATATFNVPALANDSTLYLAFSYFVDDSRFHTVSTSFAADMPYAPLPPIARPVKAAAAQVTINFDENRQRMGSSWSTRLGRGER